jgi:hypothetical protein
VLGRERFLESFWPLVPRSAGPPQQQWGGTAAQRSAAAAAATAAATAAAAAAAVAAGADPEFPFFLYGDPADLDGEADWFNAEKVNGGGDGGSGDGGECFV